MPLRREQLERYSRTLALSDFSEHDMEQLLNTRVAVVGAGGLGSPALRLLTALGFGHIRIIDRDVVDLSNLQRQTVYDMDDLGKPKALAAAENLHRMNPDVKFEPVTAVLDHRNAEELLRECNIVVDGLDSIQARMAINRAILHLSIPYVYAGAIQYYANVSTIIPGKTTPCLECFMGGVEDSPENRCERLGVAPTVLSVAAAVQVQETVRLAIGQPPLLAGRLMAIDMSDMSIDTFAIARARDCPACSRPQIVSQQEPPSRPTVTSLCSGAFSVAPPEMLFPDLQSLGRLLEQKEYSVKIMAGFLQAISKSGVHVTLMSRGNAVIRGVESAEDALSVYEVFLNLIRPKTE